MVFLLYKMGTGDMNLTQKEDILSIKTEPCKKAKISLEKDNYEIIWDKDTVFIIPTVEKPIKIVIEQ